MVSMGMRWKCSALAWGCALMLAACGGSSSDVVVDEHQDDEQHEHTHIDTAGRLLVLQADSAQVHVVDLDHSSVMQSYTLDQPASAVYASPGQRYAVLLQRAHNQVQFVDGGLWQEDHGDHLHDYMQAPALLTMRVAGVQPTHYEGHEGLAAVFFDGRADAGEPASVALLSDAGIGAGQVLASHTLEVPMHGTAEPRGDYLLTTWRAADAATTLPSHVELYRRQGAQYQWQMRFDLECPNLHGSYSNARYTVFGCSDGVLVVQQDGDSFTARKIANLPDMGTARIGTVIGHKGTGALVGIASPGHFFSIDPAAGTMQRIEWAQGRTRRAHAIDGEGNNLLVLDDVGTLHILDLQTGSKRAEIAAIATMPSAAPFPAFATSQAAGKAWLSDPQGQRLVVIDTDGARLEGEIALNFNPTGLAWLGLPAHAH